MANGDTTLLAKLVQAVRGLGYILNRRNAVAFAAVTVLVILVAAFLHVLMEDWRWLMAAGALLWGAEGLSAALADASGRARAVAGGVVMLCFVLAVLIVAITLKPYADVYLAGLRGPISI